jgi:NAD(P)-dependent dehydrogenase (short-subunit alcohol dehydrogenase family)
VVVVTGAGAGVGRATARAFARRGDFDAHGRFDAQSRPASAELWLSTHRTLGMMILAGVLGAAVGWRR